MWLSKSGANYSTRKNRGEGSAAPATREALRRGQTNSFMKRPPTPRSCALLGPLGGSYGGHFKKRASTSGEYQGTSGVTYRLMQPSKYAAQHDFFSAAVKHSGFSD